MPGHTVCVTFENELSAANVRVSSVVTDNVVCSVKRCGPRLENVRIFRYPLEAETVPVKEELFKYGDVHDILFRAWTHVVDPFWPYTLLTPH